MDSMPIDLPLRGHLCVYCNVGGIGIDETVLFVLSRRVVIVLDDA